VSKYAVFISYSREDDRVSQYASTLRQYFKDTLPAKFPVAQVAARDAAKVFLDTTEIECTGSLQQEIKNAIDDSFALMIVVGPRYAESTWCLQELQLFQARFRGQPDEMKKRLFIVITDPEAEKALLKNDLWPKGILMDSVRTLFHDGERRINTTALFRPIPGEPDYMGPNPVFTQKAEELVDRLKTLLSQQPQSNIGAPSAPRAGVLIGPTTDDVAPDAQALARALAVRSINAETLSINDFVSAGAAEKLRSRAQQCAYLVMPYSESTPLLDYLPGGHLKIIRDAAPDPARLLWWRPKPGVPNVAAGAVAGEDQRRFFEDLRPLSKTEVVEDLADEISMRMAPSGASRVPRIFVESSREHPSGWQKVKCDMLDEWKKIQPNRRLMVSALPFNGKKTQELEALRNGHGVVLLYASIGFPELCVRADLVEDVLAEVGQSPVLFVAWMPKDPPDEPHEDYVWDTVAFGDWPSTNGHVQLGSERDRLRRLLTQVAAKAGPQDDPPSRSIN